MTEARANHISARDLLFLAAAGYIAVQIHWSLVAIGVWYIALRYLEQRGFLDSWNATRVLGVILMVRTARGHGALEAVSRPRKAWRLFGEIGLWTCRFTSAIVLLVFLLTFIGTMLNPTELEATSPSELILIPGISPTIPLVWGVIGLIIALVVHEYGHGIVTRAHGMRVRSFGVLLIGLLPIGAFAEPEGRELMRAPRRERQRVFAAGPAINIYGGFLCYLALAVVANSMAPAITGVHAEGVIEEQPAASAGIQPWEVITHADGEMMTDRTAFTAFLDSHHAGDTVTLTILSLPDEAGERVGREVSVTLADQYEYQMELGTDPAILEAYGIEKGDAFLGVVGLASNDAGAQRLAGPLSSEAPKEPLPILAGLALQPIQLIFSPLNYKGEIMHLREAELLSSDSFLSTGVAMGLIHFLFWVTWMNVLLGFANLIPLLPFDGGHLLRDRLHDYFSFFGNLTGNPHPLKVQNAANRVSGMSSLILFGMMILIIIVPMLI